MVSAGPGVRRGPPAAIVSAPGGAPGKETRGDAGQDGAGVPALCPAAGEGCGVGCVIPRRRLVPHSGTTGRCRSWSLGKHPLRDSVSPVGSPECPPPMGHRGGLLPTITWGGTKQPVCGGGGGRRGAAASPCRRVSLFAAVPRAPLGARGRPAPSGTRGAGWGENRGYPQQREMCKRLGWGWPWSLESRPAGEHWGGLGVPGAWHSPPTGQPRHLPRKRGWPWIGGCLA